MLALLVVLLSGCSSNWTARYPPDPKARTVSFSGTAVLCAGGGVSTGDGRRMESCTAPVELVVGRAEGDGMVWIPGPIELAYR